MKIKNALINDIKELRILLATFNDEKFYPTLAIAMINEDLLIEEILDELEKNNIDLIAGSADSLIHGDLIADQGMTIFFIEIEKSLYRINAFHLMNDSYQLGTDIGLWIKRCFQNPINIIFISSTSISGDKLLKGFQDNAGNQTKLYGAFCATRNVADSTRFYALYNHTMIKKGAVVLSCDNDQVDITGIAVSGWKAVGTLKKVTKSDENLVLSIDDTPALDFFKRYFKLGFDQIEQRLQREYPIQLIKPNNNKVMRTVVNVNAEKKGLYFTDVIPEGSYIRFCAPNISETIAETIQYLQEYHVKNHLDPIDGLLLFSCGLRRYSFGFYIQNEVSAINRIWHAPCAGFFSMGEIGNTDTGICDYHNTTLSILFFRDKHTLNSNASNERGRFSEKNFQLDDHEKIRLPANKDQAIQYLLHEVEKLQQDKTILSNFLHCISEDIDHANLKLKATLDDLQRTQTQLIQAEKMAALGQLTAGVAHEINTPLGAIRASIGNIMAAMQTALSQLPQIFQQLSPDQQREFWAMVERGLQQKPQLTSREERAFRRSIREALTAQQLDRADDIADTLVDMGVYDNLAPLMPLLRNDMNATILQTAYQLAVQRHNSDTILTALDRVSRIVFALKSYTHYDHSGAKSSASIPENIETALILYQNQLKHGIEVIKQYAPIPEIRCYPDELKQVWTNLIHNAIWAMKGKGRLEIVVKIHESSETTPPHPSRKLREGCVVVEITDSGCGIPDAIKDRIFEPFFTTKPAGEGSGLGLDICQKIVEKHQGGIDFESQPGRTTFRVWLPDLS